MNFNLCDVCGCPMCHIYQCDTFYGGCGFKCRTCDLPEHFHENCPDCGRELDTKLYCFHPKLGGCGHVQEMEH